jgi:hypothetical protein
MIDRVSGVSIDHEGKHVLPTSNDVAEGVVFINTAAQSQITAAANAAGFYGDDATRFAREVDNATEFLIGRVAASGGDKRRFRQSRRERKRLEAEAMANAGVPKNTWLDYLWAIASFGMIALPTGPYLLVIKAVLFAMRLYLKEDKPSQ